MLKHAYQAATGLAFLGALVLAGIGPGGVTAIAAPRDSLLLAPVDMPDPTPKHFNSSSMNPANSVTWTPETSGTTEILSSVWGREHEFLAVGSGGTILYFDGSSWQPLPSGSAADLQGVWGNSMTDVFAAGPDGTILHFTGSHWTPMVTPTNEFLRGVWGTSRNNVFVTGTRGTIIRYDGGLWTAMDSGSPNRLYDIWGSAGDDVFVSGHLATILHFDGLEWTTMDSGARPTLWGVWGTAADNVFVVGGSGVIIRYDGNAWSMMDSGTSENLLRVWGASASNVYAVGSNGTILHFDGNTWSSMPSGTTRTLKGIFGTSPDNIVAVGDNGTILRYAGDSVPAFVRNFDARAIESVVDLRWQTEPAAELVGFRLHKKDTQGNECILPTDGAKLDRNVRHFRDTRVQPGQSYRYTLIVDLDDRTTFRSRILHVDIPAMDFTFEQNHPNPFNPSTQIAFSLPRTALVRVTVYDAGGRCISTLTNGLLPAGAHVVEWSGRDTRGLTVASGVYFCRIKAGNRQAVIKMTLTK